MEENILDKEFIDKKHQFFFKIRPVIIWGIALVLGVLFQIIHWPFASILILVPSAGLQAYCINGVMRRKERNTLNKVLSIMGGIWLVTLIGGVLFNNGHPYNKIGLLVYVVTFIIYFTIYYHRTTLERTGH